MIQTVLKIGEQISPSRIENYKKKRAIILSKIPFYKSLPEDSMPILLIFFLYVHINHQMQKASLDQGKHGST